MVMHPEYSTPLYHTLSSNGMAMDTTTSPTARKRRRDDPELEVVTAATSAWQPTSSRQYYQVSSIASKFSSAASKLNRHPPRHIATSVSSSNGNFIIQHAPTSRTSPKLKRPKVPSSTSSSPMATGSFNSSMSMSRSRSSSPYENSQAMQMSPEVSFATLPTSTSQSMGSTNAKPPCTPVPQQRCHICSRLPLLTFSAITIAACEQCSKPTCGICARECASCDEKTCSRCCREKGDYSFCLTCYGIMERREKGGKS